MKFTPTLNSTPPSFEFYISWGWVEEKLEERKNLGDFYFILFVRSLNNQTSLEFRIFEISNWILMIRVNDDFLERERLDIFWEKVSDKRDWNEFFSKFNFSMNLNFFPKKKIIHQPLRDWFSTGCRKRKQGLLILHSWHFNAKNSIFEEKKNNRIREPLNSRYRHFL